MLTMVFTDLVNSTPVKAALPGADLRERNRLYLETVLTPYKARVEAARAEFGGRTVDQIGDSMFLAFDSASAAARFAVALQRSVATRPIANKSAPHTIVLYLAICRSRASPSGVSAERPVRGRQKSMIVVEASELSAALRLDMAAARMAAITRPDTPGGSEFQTNCG